MSEPENPDLYVCALLAQMVTARSGDVRREFQAAVGLLQRLRQYDEEQVLQLVSDALALNDQHDMTGLTALCKSKLDDAQIREAIGLMAYLARIDGDVSETEEDIFTEICVGLGVTVSEGTVMISRE